MNANSKDEMHGLKDENQIVTITRLPLYVILQDTRESIYYGEKSFPKGVRKSSQSDQDSLTLNTYC